MQKTNREILIKAALRHVPFEGWTKRAFELAELEEGLAPGTYAAHFPGGMQEFITAMHDWVDAGMQRMIDEQDDFTDAKVREKIYRCVMARLEILRPYREAVRRLVGHQLLPWNKPAGMRDLARIADAVWKCAGDRSVDYNFYTKRLLLGGVYATALHHWLQDESENAESTRQFLRARIEDVLKFGKFVSDIKERFRKAA